MVVAGAQMRVTAQAAAGSVALPAHNHQHLGVCFVADDAVNDMSADFFELGGPADIGFFVEARHEFDDDGDFLAVACGAQQRLHQHGIRSGAIDGHLDGNDLRIGGSLVNERNNGQKTLVRVMQQNVVFTQGFKNTVPLVERLGQARRKWRKLQIRPVDLVGNLDETGEIDRAANAVKIAAAETELGQQKISHMFRAVVRNLQPHGVAEVALGQFPLDFDAQVFGFFFIDE